MDEGLTHYLKSGDFFENILDK
ncbi:hypothetical protein DSUL_40008 [Desulfovibrionales bacterium]